MSRAPFVVPGAEPAFSRKVEVFDSAIGWRLVNPLMPVRCGIEPMPETAENMAAEFAISREDQDASPSARKPGRRGRRPRAASRARSRR